jgi:hypothetical protein
MARPRHIITKFVLWAVGFALIFAAVALMN